MEGGEPYKLVEEGAVFLVPDPATFLMRGLDLVADNGVDFNPNELSLSVDSAKACLYWGLASV